MLEFFNHHSRLTAEADMVKKDTRYFLLSSILTEAEAQRILSLLLEDKKAREIILKMREAGITGSIALVRRFKVCNWDALEHIPDITNDDKLNFEYIHCGSKGANRRCPFSTPLDPKPYCILKNRFNIPNHHAESCTNRKHIA